MKNRYRKFTIGSTNQDIATFAEPRIYNIWIKSQIGKKDNKKMAPQMVQKCQMRSQIKK